jgi:hypothetical protein
MVCEIKNMHHGFLMPDSDHALISVSIFIPLKSTGDAYCLSDQKAGKFIKKSID